MTQRAPGRWWLAAAPLVLALAGCGSGGGGSGRRHVGLATTSPEAAATLQAAARPSSPPMRATAPTWPAAPEGQPRGVPRGRRPHAREPDPRLRQPARRRPRASRRRGDLTTRPQRRPDAGQQPGDPRRRPADPGQLRPGAQHLQHRRGHHPAAGRRHQVGARRSASDDPALQRRPRPRRRRRRPGGPPAAPGTARARPPPPSAASAPARTAPAAPPRTMPTSVGPAPGPAGRQRAGVDRGRPAARAPRGTAPCGPAGGCGRPSPRPRACAGSARPASRRPMRPRLNTTSARADVSGSTLPASGVARSRSGTMTTKASSSSSGSGACTGRPPTMVASDQSAEHAGRRVLGMPVVGGGHGEGVLGAGGGGGRGGQRGGGPQPPRDGDLRAHGDREAVVAQHLGRDPGGQVGRVVEEAGPLALAVHAQGRGRLDLDAHVAVERRRRACRNPARGSPTRRGPGRARGQVRRVRTGAGEAARAVRPAAAAPGRATRWVPSVTTTVPTRCATAAPASPAGAPARTPRVALTPGQVSIEAVDAAVAPTRVPASLHVGHDAGRAHHRRGRRSAVPSASTSASAVQPRLRQHLGPGLPGHGSQQEHRLAVHGPHHGQHVTPAGRAW